MRNQPSNNQTALLVLILVFMLSLLCWPRVKSNMEFLRHKLVSSNAESTSVFTNYGETQK